jgi:hypothetical protein
MFARKYELNRLFPQKQKVIPQLVLSELDISYQRISVYDNGRYRPHILPQQIDQLPSRNAIKSADQFEMQVVSVQMGLYLELGLHADTPFPSSG